jgi:hypothetical protein
MTKVHGLTPKGQAERTVEVTYDKGEDRHRLRLWIRVGNSDGVEIRVRVKELLMAILHEAGVE